MFGLRTRRKNKNTPVKTLSRRWKLVLETLEDRTVPAYNFTHVGSVGTVTPVAPASDPLWIEEFGGFIYHSTDGVVFSPDWGGGVNIAASTASSININLNSGAGSTLRLGGVLAPASSLFASIFLGPLGTPANNDVIVDDTLSAHATGNYDFYPNLGAITGPGGTSGGLNFTSFGPANSYVLMGSTTVGNTYNIHSTFNATTTSTTIDGGTSSDIVNVLGDVFPGIGTPLSINMVGGTANVLSTNAAVNITSSNLTTVNIGSTGGAGTMVNILGPISVTNPASLTALNFHDENDLTARTWTLNNNDGGSTGSVAVTGFATTNYNPFDLSSLTVNGGSGGNTFTVNNTSAFFPTTLKTGTGVDTVNVLATGSNTLNITSQALATVNVGSTGGAGTMANIQGTVNVINPVSLTALKFHDENDVTARTWTLNNNDGGPTGSVAVTGIGTTNYNPFDLSSLTVNDGSGGNTFTVNNTSAFFPTTLKTGTGIDTVNVLATGSNTLSITSQALATVNMGSTGGAGTMANIQGAVSILNPPSLTAVNYHDENDVTGRTWTLVSNDGVPSGSVAVTGSATTTFNPFDLPSQTIKGGSGNDQFNITPDSLFPMTIDGGAGTNTATFDLAGVTNPQLTPTGPNSYIASFGNRQSVTLTNFQIVNAINGSFGLVINGTNQNDVFRISRSGANIVITLSTNGGAATTVFNGPAVTYTSITFNGLDGNDQLIVDETGGTVTNLLTFNGGNPVFPATPGDSVQVLGGTYANLIYTASGVGTGSLNLDGNILNFTSTEPVTVTSALGNVLVNLTDAAAHTTTLGDDATAGNNLSQVSIDGGIESLTFTNPTNFLTFVGNNNTNTVILNALDTASLTPNISIVGGPANDEIQIRSAQAGQSVDVLPNGGVDHTVIGGSTFATFNTGSAAANLANIQGTVNVLTNSASTVYIDDSGFAGGRTITSNNIAVMPFFPTQGVQVTAIGLTTQINVANGASGVQTASGAGNDTFRVNTTLVSNYGNGTTQTFFGNNGNDNFFVRPSTSAGISVFGGAPAVGDPNVPPDGDRLVVNAYDATVTPLFSSDGQVIAPGLQPVLFNNVEFVTVPDRFEINDTPSQATFLGSDPTVNLMNLSIHSVDDPTTPNVNEADVDYFRYVAHDTGYLTINAQYLSVLGGQLVVEVYRPTSLANLSGPNVIGAPFNNPANYITSTPGAIGTIDGTTLNIPVVKGQVYYIKVRGNNQQLDAGNYNLEIENFAAAVPTVVNMPANLPGSPVGTNDNDTGRSNTDGITNNASPYFIVQDDLRDLANAGVAMLTGAQATAGQTAGAAVQVYVRTFGGVPITSFFADPVAGSNNTLWSIRTTTLPDGNYQITASTVIFDNNSPNGLAAEVKRSGVTQLGSPPLNFTIDTVAPAPPSLFLNPPDDSGIPGQPGTYVDNISKYSAANFTGNSESNSWVQFYAIDKTATPQFDGTAVANAFGQYFIDPTFDLNNPAFFNLDGERNLLATATDVAGNQSAPQNLQIFLDTSGPRVAGVSYRFVDANGNIQVVNLLDQTLNGTKVALPAINYIDVTLLDQPNRTTNFLYPAANELLATTPGNYAIVGKRTGAVTIASVIVLEDDTVVGSIGLTTYRLLLSKPLANDQYTFKIFDRIQDQAGNALDGDFQPPILPSGDGVPGGNFVATFSTANSSNSTKLGFYANGTVNLDLNGNFIVDPGSTVGSDAVIPYSPNGSAVFSGQFFAPGQTTVDGFDRLGTYGKEGGKYVFRLDYNNDGDFSDPGETIVQTGLQINGLPIAGNWGPSAVNMASGLLTGSNVGVFDGKTWYLDTNGNNIIDSGDTILKGNMRGLPFTGDFDGDGKTDLGTYQNGVFYLDLSSHDAGGVLTGNTNYTFRAALPLQNSGTASRLARPVAGNFDGSGISSIGLFIPNQTTVPVGQANWFLMNSNGVPWDIAAPSGSTRPFKTASTGLGTDFAVTYGSARALPVVGNFDPSTRKSTTTATVPGLKQVLANVAHGLTDLYFSSTDSTDFVIGKLRKGKGR